MTDSSNSSRPTGINLWAKAFSSLRISNYRWFWISLVLGMLIMQMQMLARGWLVYEMTDSPFLLGLVVCMTGIPMVLATPLGGVITDRFNKRNVILYSEIISTIISVLICILLITDRLQIWHIMFFSFIGGIAFAANLPARQAIIAELVGESQLVNGITLNSIGGTIGRILGPSLAGILAGIIGITGVYIITTILSSVVIIAIIMISAKEMATSHKAAHPFRELAQGFYYTYHNRIIFALVMLGGITTLLGMTYMTLMPVFARDILDLGPTGLGLLTTAVAVGSLIGSLVIAFIGNIRRKGFYMLASIFLLGLGLILFSVSKNFYLSCLFLGVVGVFNSLVLVINNTMVQIIVEPGMRGRVLSLFAMTIGLQGVGSLPLGAFAEFAGAPLSVAISGALLVFTVIIMNFSAPKLRQL